MKLFTHGGYVHRLTMDMALLAIVALMAVLGEAIKAGHLVALRELVEHVLRWMAHVITDVAQAEVTATMLFRVFGAFKE